MQSVTVFCGSSMGADPQYAQIAYDLGAYLAQQGIDLVYGGAQVGLMGRVADGALELGGRVIGVIPQFLETKEIKHHQLTELIIVKSMHDRKSKMNDLCDGVIALPGGFGTLEELFEVLTWAQLGLHQKPIGLLNVGSYYTHLIQLLQTMVTQGFLKQINMDMLLVDDAYSQLLDRMQQYQAPDVPKWINKDLI